MPGKILGLDISSNYITAVQVASTLKGYQVTMCCHASIKGSDGLGNALESIFTQPGLKSDICLCSIPAENFSYRNLYLPFHDPKKIRQTLPFEIETMVPYPVEDLLVDFTVIDRADQTEVLTAAVKKEVISDLLDGLRSRGVDPDVMEIRCVPTVLWLLGQEKTPEDGLFLQMDGRKNTLVMFLKKRLVLVRAFTLNDVPDIPALSDETPRLNEEKRSSGQPVPPYHTLFTQVKNTVHSFAVRNNRDIHPEIIFYSGLWAGVPDTQQALTRLFDVPAEAVDPANSEKVVMEADVALSWDPALMGNALALALKDARQGQGFNFRKDIFEKKKHYFGSGKEVRRTCVFLIILLCFLIANAGTDYYFLKKRYEAVNRNITEIFRKTLPEMKKIPRGKEVDVMRSEIDKLKKSSVSLQIPTGNRGVLDLLKDISERIPKSLTVRITRMVIDMEAVRISGTTDTFNTVDKIKSGLASLPCFSTAVINSAKLDRSGKRVEFEIKLDRSGQ
ncbi:MAG: hypothetical protein DRH37_09980 [Deltaproteobacteria bacterium]|nr:MAG: hypothetical protein DRH37_09980 [Deltaproteobacteria bacterium]